jgi:hypothetical protein
MGKEKSKIRGASSSSASAAAAAVSEAAIEEACRTGDLRKLRRWARQGVRVATAIPLRIAVVKGLLDVMRCLVFELGADVDQGALFDIGAADEIVAPPLFIAAAYGLLLVVNCLVKELGANVNQRSQEGTTPIYIAAARE